MGKIAGLKDITPEEYETIESCFGGKVKNACAPRADHVEASRDASATTTSGARRKT